MFSQLLRLTLVLCFAISSSYCISQNSQQLKRENDSLRLELRLSEIKEQNKAEIEVLKSRLDQQDKILSNTENQVGNWVGFTEGFFGVVGVILALFAFFGYRQIKQYGEIARRDQQEMEKIVIEAKTQQSAIKTRHEELQKFQPEEALTIQNKKVLEQTIIEAKQQLEKSGLDAFKNLFHAKAIAASDKGDWENSLRYCQNYLDFDESNAEIWHRLGRSRKELDYSSDKIIEAYSWAIQLNPKLAKSYNNRALIYQDLRKFEDALYDFNKAIEIDPQDPLYYCNRAMLHSQLGETDKEKNDFEKAFIIDPNNSRSFNIRGCCFIKSGLTKEALEDFSMAIKHDPHEPMNYYNRHLCYQQIGETKKAHEDIKKAHHLNPADSRYSNALKSFEIIPAENMDS